MGKKADKKSAQKKDKTLKAEKKKDKKAKSKKGKNGLSRLSAEERLEMISTAAYYIAEQHGFTPGRAENDWAEAERQIEKRLRKKSKD